MIYIEKLALLASLFASKEDTNRANIFGDELHIILFLIGNNKLCY